MHDEEPGIILLAFESNAAARQVRAVDARVEENEEEPLAPNAFHSHQHQSTEKGVPPQLDDLDIFLFNRNHIVLNRNQNSVH